MEDIILRPRFGAGGKFLSVIKIFEEVFMI